MMCEFANVRMCGFWKSMDLEKLAHSHIGRFTHFFFQLGINKQVVLPLGILPGGSFYMVPNFKL